jgi:hypothetical protein
MGVRLPWQWLASPALPTVSRCCAAEIKIALLALLAGEAFLARRSWQEIWWGRMQLDLASGWQLHFEIEHNQLSALQWARSPDRRDWQYGCQRDDWTLGPDSQIVEPVGLLNPEQRLQLERLLRGALCWPPPLVSSDWMVPMASVELSGHSRRGLRRRRQSVANQMAHHADVVPKQDQKA